IAAYLSSTRRRARRAVELAAQGLVTTAPTARTRRRRHIPFGLFVIALAALAVALARPEANLRTPHREGTVILAFDVSNSMAAKDLEPSRIEAAKVAARAFVERQPDTIRIGVVAFGDGAAIVQQPTNTQVDVLAAIDRLSIAGGTSLGQGLFTSLSAIAGKPLAIDEAALGSDGSQIDIGYFGSSAVIVLSDGENTGRPDPVTVAQIASVAGVHVHTIGVGTVDGTVVEIDGFNVATALNRDLLNEVASVTDGTYYEATDAHALADVYKSIHLDLKSQTRHTEITALFTGGAALILVIGALLSVFWFGRVV
ncbi:MAG TPA: VWA domain-containing protein, partial [Acidimicrobiales bacterium]|nr:VWA domain-containing protein [Acidimicrobiales bacterium]